MTDSESACQCVKFETCMMLCRWRQQGGVTEHIDADGNALD